MLLLGPFSKDNFSNRNKTKKFCIDKNINLRYFSKMLFRRTDYVSRDILNPLTPVPPVTACDEPWHFFLFWRHDFWPKLASSILNFCRTKRSFQWCPDQSDRPNGALDMHKNAQNVEWKIQTKISSHYNWVLHDKNCPSQCFLRNFFNCKQAQ